MSKKVSIVALACVLASGCVNIVGARNPWSTMKVEECYQSTRLAASAAIITAFPQLMSDSPSTEGFMVENVFTIPLSLFVFADAICEIPFDTLFLPYDWFASGKGK